MFVSEPDPEPVPVSTMIQFARLAVGQKPSCGPYTAGKACCRGSNSTGQLGRPAI